MGITVNVAADFTSVVLFQEQICSRKSTTDVKSAEYASTEELLGFSIPGERGLAQAALFLVFFTPLKKPISSSVDAYSTDVKSAATFTEAPDRWRKPCQFWVC